MAERTKATVLKTVSACLPVMSCSAASNAFNLSGDLMKLTVG
jgi:hypothetical protein